METKKNLRARKYSSPLLKEVLNSVTEVGKAQSRLRLTIAARIDDYRKAGGMTKKDLAKKLGRQPSEVTKWMSGTHNFTTDTLVEIAVALGVDIKDLQTYYSDEVVTKQELWLESNKLEPVIVLMTPGHTRKSQESYQVKVTQELISNSYSPYVA